MGPGWDGAMRTPRPEWVAALHALAPRTDTPPRTELPRLQSLEDDDRAAEWAGATWDGGTSWLHLRWEPGDPWEPIGRWCIWHMYPYGSVPERVRAGLYGVHPRSTGHYCAAGWCACDLKTNGWRDGPETAFGISRQSWELFRETGCYGVRLWIVQGDRGGHLYRFDPLTSKVAKLHGHPADTPAPGDLPYADPDARTWAQLAALDRMRQWGARYLGEYTARAADVDQAHARERRQEAQALLSHWIDEQCAAFAPELRSALRRAPEIPRARDLSPLDGDAVEHAFLHADD